MEARNLPTITLTPTPTLTLTLTPAGPRKSTSSVQSSKRKDSVSSVEPRWPFYACLETDSFDSVSSVKQYTRPTVYTLRIHPQPAARGHAHSGGVSFLRRHGTQRARAAQSGTLCKPWLSRRHPPLRAWPSPRAPPPLHRTSNPNPEFPRNSELPGSGEVSQRGSIDRRHSAEPIPWPARTRPFTPHTPDTYS